MNTKYHTIPPLLFSSFLQNNNEENEKKGDFYKDILDLEEVDDPHIVACLIKAYFRDLEHPLFPNEAWFVLLLVCGVGFFVCLFL